jgi:hypothetical protein
MPTNRKRLKRTPKKIGTLTESLVDFFLKGKLPGFQDPDPDDIFALYFFDTIKAKNLWLAHREKVLHLAEKQGISKKDIFAIQQYEEAENV